MKKVSVVIPVYGQWNLAKRNIDALLKYDCANISEIIVVDDCSPEQNPYQFDPNFVRIVKNEKNLGYTGTVNNGLRNATTEIIILLDSDAYPIGPFVNKVLEMFEASLSIGCIGFSTIDDVGNTTGSYRYEPSISGLIAGQFLESKLAKFDFRNNKPVLPYSCSVSFRKECLEELGYLDEKAFPVLDADHDISMRIHRSKWQLIHTEDIIVCHSGGNSYKINYKRVLLYYKSRWKLLKKHNMIKSPYLSKFLIKSRLRMELLLLQFLCFIKAGGGKYEEKKLGRKIILEEVEMYEL